METVKRFEPVDEVCKFIRIEVFGLPTKASFARAIGVAPATVSQWETRQRGWSHEMMNTIRDEALHREGRSMLQRSWSDVFFFEVPRGELRAA